MRTFVVPPPQLVTGLPSGNRTGGVFEASYNPDMYGNANTTTVPSNSPRSATVPQKITSSPVGFQRLSANGLGYAPTPLPGWAMPPEAQVPNGGVFNQQLTRNVGTSPVPYRRATNGMGRVTFPAQGQSMPCPKLSEAEHAYQMIVLKLKEHQLCALAAGYQVGSICYATPKNPICGLTGRFIVMSDTQIYEMARRQKAMIESLVKCCKSRGIPPGNLISGWQNCPGL